jgi:hypothetical protein
MEGARWPRLTWTEAAHAHPRKVQESGERMAAKQPYADEGIRGGVSVTIIFMRTE